VGTHERVHLARANREIDALEDFSAVFLDRGMKIRDFEKIHPTDPSSETPSSFCASTANSIGSSLRTRLAKPLTMSETASAAESPRWRQSKSWSSPIFDVDASCSSVAELFLTSM